MQTLLKWAAGGQKSAGLSDPSSIRRFWSDLLHCVELMWKCVSLVRRGACLKWRGLASHPSASLENSRALAAGGSEARPDVCSDMFAVNPSGPQLKNGLVYEWDALVQGRGDVDLPEGDNTLKTAIFWMEFGLFTRYISWSRRVFKSGIWEDSFDLKTEKSMKLFVSGLNNKFLFFQVYIILYPNIVILLVISAFKQKVCNLLILMILLFIIRH